MPRDGDQRIELSGTAPNRASYVTAFNLHPALVAGDSAEFPARQSYHVPVKEMHEAGQEAADPRVIYVPYRSTLKKFQAEWIGKQLDDTTPLASGASAPLPAGIDGTVKLSSEIPLVTGTLSNNTGHDLRMVYFVVHNPGIARDTGTIAQDLVLYLSYWPKGGRVSLTNEFQIPTKGGAKTINLSPDPRLIRAALRSIITSRPPAIGLTIGTKTTAPGTTAAMPRAASSRRRTPCTRSRSRS